MNERVNRGIFVVVILVVIWTNYLVWSNYDALLTGETHPGMIMFEGIGFGFSFTIFGIILVHLVDYILTQLENTKQKVVT